MTKHRLAVIQFPGSNCEYETAFAAENFGFSVEIIRWNAEPSEFQKYDAYIIPGGFSFQDRIRAGVISSKLPVMQHLKESALQKKVILGICNGCQILAESGFFPNIGQNYQVEVALAPNQKDHDPIGFICDWKYVRVKNPQKSAFTRYFSESDILPIPINHGEGRFVFKTIQKTDFSPLTHFQYCSESGEISDQFPVTPNGSAFGLAGLCNTTGNILGIMPHPERASFVKQIPTWLNTSWVQEKENNNTQKENNPGPWSRLFLSMSDYISEQKGQ